jgi:hypothetical protein
VRYTERLIGEGHREFAALLVRDAVQRSPQIQNSYSFIGAQAGEIGKIIRGE